MCTHTHTHTHIHTSFLTTITCTHTHLYSYQKPRPTPADINFSSSCTSSLSKDDHDIYHTLGSDKGIAEKHHKAVSVDPYTAEQSIFNSPMYGRSSTTSTRSLSDGCRESDPLLVGYNGRGHRRSRGRGGSLSLVSVRSDWQPAEYGLLEVEAVSGTAWF